MTVIVLYCFLEELLGAAEIRELTSGTEVTLYWFALGSQLVCHAIQRHALKALLGQPSPHIKICNRKKGNVYGLQEKRQSSLIRSNKNLENILHFIRLCNWSQSLCHQKETYGRQIIPHSPTGMFLRFVMPTLLHLKEDAKLESQKTRTSLSFRIFNPGIHFSCGWACNSASFSMFFAQFRKDFFFFFPFCYFAFEYTVMGYVLGFQITSLSQMLRRGLQPRIWFPNMERIRTILAFRSCQAMWLCTCINTQTILYFKEKTEVNTWLGLYLCKHNCTSFPPPSSSYFILNPASWESALTSGLTTYWKLKMSAPWVCLFV